MLWTEPSHMPARHPDPNLPNCSLNDIAIGQEHVPYAKYPGAVLCTLVYAIAE